MSNERRHESMRTHGNRHGFRGVFWDARKGKFGAEIWPTPGAARQRLGMYDTAELAARAYDAAARTLYGVDAYLNFPNAGERKAEKTNRPDGLCPKGHDLSEHGYARPDGRGTNCRMCNRDSANRSYRRRSMASQHAPDTREATKPFRAGATEPKPS